MSTRVGRYTILLDTHPTITGYAGVVGKKEGEGPLGNCFDAIYDDDTLGEASWEKSESTLQREAVIRALDKANRSPAEVDIILAGDLLNQCIGTTYGIRELNIPFLGLFGACSTMALSLSVGGMITEAKLAGTVVAATSSHFCSAERQFRYPLEYGGQRPPSAQWTVTGAGAAVINADAPDPGKPHIAAVTLGRIVDMGVRDANNMGAAMAPCAASTIEDFLKDTKTQPGDYDAIITGDLGMIGAELLLELLQKRGIDLSPVHQDCGTLIFDLNTQGVEAGGSGCGCSGSVICSYFMQKLERRELSNILFAGTGALMSPTASQQGESIPGICHLVQLCMD